MEHTGISNEKEACFREEEPKKVDFVQVKDFMVAAMEEAAKIQEENKQLREQLLMERTTRENAEQLIKELQEKHNQEVADLKKQLEEKDNELAAERNKGFFKRLFGR